MLMSSARSEWVARQLRRCRRCFVAITLLTGWIAVSAAVFLYTVVVFQFLGLVLDLHSRNDSLSLLQSIALFANHLSTPSALQYLNMSNMTVHALYIFILVLIVYIDGVLMTVREKIRSRAKLPSEEVISHFNDRAYAQGIDLISTVQKMR